MYTINTRVLTLLQYIIMASSSTAPYQVHDKSMGQVAKDISAYGSSKTVSSLKKLSAETINASTITVGRISTPSPVFTLFERPVIFTAATTLANGTPYYLIKNATQAGHLDIVTSNANALTGSYPFEIHSIAVIALNSDKNINITAQIETYDEATMTWTVVPGSFLPNDPNSTDPVFPAASASQSYGIFMPTTPIPAVTLLRLRILGNSAAFTGTNTEGFDISVIVNVL